MGDRSRPKIVRWVVLALVAVLVLAAAWLAVRALTVKSELDAAARIVAEVQDGADLGSSVTALSGHAASAAAAAGDPVWRAAEIIPAAGDNLRAVRLAAQSLDALVNGVGVPLLAEASDEGLLERLLRVAVTDGVRVAELARELEEVRGSSFLIDPVANGVERIAEVTSVAAPALEMVPALLGADEAKTYLMVFQNNAEALALGGSPAAQTLIHAEAGKISMGAQADSGRYRNGTAVDVPVDESALSLFGPYLTGHMNTSMMRPDFPTAAQLLKAWWQRDIGDDRIDGVVSVDPIALSRILVATGPVGLPTGDELTSENAVDLLLSEVYARWDSYKYPELVDGFFAAAAAAVFDRVAAGDFDVKDMLWALNESVAAGDVLVWSDDERIAKAVQGARASGALPADNTAATTVGVYYNNTSASKIDYYTRSQVRAVSVCTDGARETTVGSTLRLDITQDAADKLPRYVKSRHYGSAGFSTNVYLYGPVGAEIESVAVDGREVTVVDEDADDLGRPVAAFAVFLAPGEEASVTAVFSSAAEGGPLEVQATPMIRAGKHMVEDACAG